MVRSSSTSIFISAPPVPGSRCFVPTMRAAMMADPTTVEDIAFPAKSRRLSSLSLVKRSSSIGRPCILNASRPNTGPPLFEMYGSPCGVRHGQIAYLEDANPLSTFCDKFNTWLHTSVQRCKEWVRFVVLIDPSLRRFQERNVEKIKNP